MLRARYRRILLFFARILISLILWELVLPRLGLRSIARRTRSRRLREIAAAFRRIAVDMGGVLIKVGQFLSARIDVLPDEITAELAGLQDEVQPEELADILQVVEAEFGTPVSEQFAAFHPVPLAAASLGQVHRAELNHPSATNAGPQLRSVVVKIQRPGIERLIATDLAALRRVGTWLKRYPPIRRRADVDALLAEFSRILYEEIDYLAEGRNAGTFAANFKDRTGVRVPRVVWSHTTRRVLTLEDVYAIKITDFAAITAAGVNRARVADRLFQVYLRQIFEDGFFHADPHPGNLFVTPGPQVPEGEERDWMLTFVDFGMVGRVPAGLRGGLRELLIAVGTRDPGRMVAAYQMLGVLLPEADLDMLERAETAVFDRFWGKSMSELREITPQEITAITVEFRQLLYRMPFQVPEDLILLGRTVGILSGLCTGLEPDFNVWDGLAPFARKLVAEEAVSGWEYWLEEVGALVRTLLTLPRRTESVLAALESGRLSFRLPEIELRIRRLELGVQHLMGGVIFAALLVAGVQLTLAGYSLLGGLMLVGALIALLWTMLVSRSP